MLSIISISEISYLLTSLKLAQVNFINFIKKNNITKLTFLIFNQKKKEKKIYNITYRRPKKMACDMR